MPCWNYKDFLQYFQWFCNSLGNFHGTKSQHTETLKRIKLRYLRKQQSKMFFISQKAKADKFRRTPVKKFILSKVVVFYREILLKIWSKNNASHWLFWSYSNKIFCYLKQNYCIVLKGNWNFIMKLFKQIYLRPKSSPSYVS